ncbi:hypothetical protein HMPREF9622_01842 [Cutibacterium modestum HL037PA3]|nr:hypothetical protein HMPREF9622_01842 [Cutibacterium modestum HL037PA3]
MAAPSRLTGVAMPGFRHQGNVHVPTWVRHSLRRECATIANVLQEGYPQVLWVMPG